MEPTGEVLEDSPGGVPGDVPDTAQDGREARPLNPIRAVLEYIGDNGGWYNAGKILPHFDETMVFWIIGERRIGKTDLLLQVACLLWQHYRLKTMWLRNKREEVKGSNVSTFLNDAKLRGWCPETWTVDEHGVREGPDRDSETLILFSSISTFSNRRGGAHPDVVMMVLDEFCPEDRRYPPMAATALMSLTKTVFSGRTDARLFCLSNFTEATNPYFVKMRIFPARGQDVTLFRDKRMLIERCAGYRKAIGDGNPWEDVYRGAGVENYASEDEDDLMKLIGRMPKGLKPSPFLISIDGTLYRRWTGKGVWWAEFRGDPKGIVIYTPNVTEVTDRVALAPKYLLKDINDCLELGALRFTHPNVMFAILNMVYDAI